MPTATERIFLNLCLSRFHLCDKTFKHLHSAYQCGRSREVSLQNKLSRRLDVISSIEALAQYCNSIH